MVETFTQQLKEYFRSPRETKTSGLVLSGGGARSAYQAGVVRYLAEAFPDVDFPIMTGVSAGAINAAHLGNHMGTFPEAADNLVDSWHGLELENIVEPESGFSMLWGMLRRQETGEGDPLTSADVRRSHGLLNTTPLWNYLRRRLDAENGRLTGIQKKVDEGRLHAVAVITTSYMTGQTVTWIQGDDVEVWERPDRVSVQTDLTLNHVMASTAIPLIFPAVRIGNAWYGDGGIRLSAPLAPAVHLGAEKILAISNRYGRSREEADEPAVQGYPPVAQIIGILMNSIFIDALNQDADTLERINKLVEELPPTSRDGIRPIEYLEVRPSVDLGRLAHQYEMEIPASMRFLTAGLGTTETESPDWLSVLLFQPAYIDRLLDIGYNDARVQHDRIAQFLSDEDTSGESSESAFFPRSANVSEE